MTDVTATKAIPDEIQVFLDSWVDALRAKDVDAYAACYTNDVRVFDGMNPPQFQGIDAWKEMISRWFGEVGTESDLTLKNVEAHVTDSLIVITSIAGYSDLPEGASEKRVMWCRQTSVLRTTPDGWRICHEHSSVPMMHETGQGDFNMQP